MHVYPCLAVESDDDALQTPHVLVVVDGDPERDLITAEKATFQNLDCSRDSLPFNCGSTAIGSYEPASIGHGVDRSNAVLCA